MALTKIYSNYKTFQKRKDKKLNGCTRQFYDANNFTQEILDTDDENVACFNCLNCKHCRSCKQCKNCNYSDDCHLCVDCDHCEECFDCSYSSSLTRCSECTSSKHLIDEENACMQ